MEHMNVLVAVNRSYVPHLKALICSLGTTNEVVIDIYIMHSELEPEILAELKGVVHRYTGGDLVEIKLSGALLKEATILSHFSVEMYYRIFATDYLPSHIHRILWLDSDIIVHKSLVSFYQSDFCGKSIMVCAHRERKEEEPLINQEACQRLGFNECDIYFNSGVILMNLDKMRTSFCRETAMQLIQGIPDRPAEHRILYPDQDILNILYRDDKIIADKGIYNYQVHHNWGYVGEEEHIRENVVILHYLGPAKPWKYQTSHFSYRYYWTYFLQFGSKWTYRIYQIEKTLYAFFKQLKKLGKRIIK